MPPVATEEQTAAPSTSTAPETITPASTSSASDGVNTSVTPEPDLLTKVSQYKAPVTQDKIVNPPEQPELAAITDPVAKAAAQEAVERIRRGMQSDYTRKLEDAQRLVEQSKSWTPQRIKQELLSNPEFLAAAQMVEGNSNKSNSPSITKEEYSALTETEQQAVDKIPELQNEIQQMKEQAALDVLRTNINQRDTTLQTKYADYNPKEVSEDFTALSKMNIVDVREYIYKAKNHDKHVQSAYELGKLEGQGKLNNKLGVIAPTGTNSTNNIGVPTKNSGESDKAYFVRLGQFRLAQFNKK